MNYLSICLFENKKKRILSLDSLYSKLLTTNEKKKKNAEAIIKRKLSYSCKLKGDQMKTGMKFNLQDTVNSH